MRRSGIVSRMDCVQKRGVGEFTLSLLIVFLVKIYSSDFRPEDPCLGEQQR